MKQIQIEPYGDCFIEVRVVMIRPGIHVAVTAEYYRDRGLEVAECLLYGTETQTELHIRNLNDHIWMLSKGVRIAIPYMIKKETIVSMIAHAGKPADLLAPTISFTRPLLKPAIIESSTEEEVATRDDALKPKRSTASFTSSPPITVEESANEHRIAKNKAEDNAKCFLELPLTTALEKEPEMLDEMCSETDTMDWQSESTTTTQSRRAKREYEEDGYCALEKKTVLEPFESRIVDTQVFMSEPGPHVAATAKHYQTKHVKTGECILAGSETEIKLRIQNNGLQRIVLGRGARIASLYLVKESSILKPLIDNEKKSESRARAPAANQHQYSSRPFSTVAKLIAAGTSLWFLFFLLSWVAQPSRAAMAREIPLSIPDVAIEREDFDAKFNIGKQLDSTEESTVKDLLWKYRSCFYFEGDSTGLIPGETFKIHLKPDAKPVRRTFYRVSASEKKVIEKTVREWLRTKVIVPSYGEWASPAMLVYRTINGNTKIRMCVDYRELNAQTVSDKYPLPLMEDGLEFLGGNKYFSSMDGRSMFHQIAVEPSSQEYTGFTCHLGFYKFTRVPFGLKNAPGQCSRAMNRVFRDEVYKSCYLYLDDIAVATKVFDKHTENLDTVLSRLKTNGIKLNPEKCTFASDSIQYLGYVITEYGIIPDPDRTAAFQEFPIPLNQTEIKQFLGFGSYYRRFVINFAQIAAPLTSLLRKGVEFDWGTEQQLAFETIKRVVTSPPILAHYDPDAELELRTDASGLGLGAHLVQREKIRFLAYYVALVEPYTDTKRITDRHISNV